LALYVDNSGNAGYLRGSFAGDASLNAQMWEAVGTVYPEAPLATGIDYNSSDIAYGGGWSTLSGQLGSTGTIENNGGGDYYSHSYLKTASIIDWSTSTALPWGIYSGVLKGPFDNPENATTWTSRIGGEADFGAYFDETGTWWSNDWSYYIADTASTWADGILSASLTGRFLGHTRMGDPAIDPDTGIAGDVSGNYNTATGTYQAVNLGTWSGIDLLFSSRRVDSDYDYLNFSFTHAVRQYNGRYDYSGGGYFYYNYTGDNSWGYREEHLNPDNFYSSYTWTYYYSDGTTSTGGYDADGNFLGSTEGTWTGNLADVVPIPTPPTGQDAILDYEDEWIDSSYSGWSNVLLGGTVSLWTGSNIPFTLMGSYDDYGMGSIWLSYSPISSYDYKKNTYTTYDGGAYYGLIGGIKNGNTLEGLFTAIYIAPNGSAGYLREGDYYAGEVYQGIGMFEMDGTINRTEIVSNIGIAAAELYNNIGYSGYSYPRLSGNFNGAGSISSEPYFNIYSIAGEPWGIYGGELYGEFENPNAESTWNSHIGGEADFPELLIYNSVYGENVYSGTGDTYISYSYYDDNSYGYLRYYSDGTGDLPYAYYYITYDSDGTYSKYDYSTGEYTYGIWDPETENIGDIVTEVPTEWGTSWYNDYENSYPNYNYNPGYILAETASTWEDGVLGASLNGRFLTQFQMGTISGDLLGTYTGTTDGLWEAVSLGTWSGTDLAFVSDLGWSSISYAVWEYNGDYYTTNGDWYYYWYYGDNSEGYVSFYDATGYSTNTYYDRDGTTSTYDSSTGQFTYGEWNPGVDSLESILSTAPEGYDWIEESSSYLTTADSGEFSGLMGGTTSLWAGSDIPVTIMGDYWDYGMGSSIWYIGELFSYNYIDGTETTYDGGVYYGYLGGIALENGSTASLEGGLIAWYIDPNGNAGYLIGSSITGSTYPDIEMFEMDGTINRVEMVTTGTLTPDIWSNIYWGYYIGLDGSGTFSGGGTISLDDSGWESTCIVDNPWGIWRYYSYGEYDGTTSDTWSMSLNDPGTYNSYSPLIGIDGTQWSGNEIEGDAAGSWVDIYTAQTGVLGGELMGTFDPNQYTWESVAAGAWIETGTFLAMAATEDGRAKLEQLNIPYVEIGRDTLSGTGGYSGTMTVEMADTIFFAYSTGEPPSIWASGSVTGSGSTGTSEIGSSVTLNGMYLSAEFAMQNWSSGSWRAEVNNGSGTLESGHSVTFEGDAAGTHPGDGTFTGTAAGVVK
ncbi:MAG: hypothetical protein AMS27_18055, partial [Bacteroides sp. SM23_62_1]